MDQADRLALEVLMVRVDPVETEILISSFVYLDNEMYMDRNALYLFSLVSSVSLLTRLTNFTL